MRSASRSGGATRNLDLRTPRLVVLLLLAAARPADATAAELPFELWEHLVVVQGSIGPLERLRFLIDTGSARTIIDRRIAAKLRLPRLPGALVVRAFDQPAEAFRTAVPGLAYGPVRVPSFSGLVAGLSPRLGAGRIDAIVGLDLLRLNSFVIDYRSRRLEIGPVNDPPFSVPFRSRFPLLSVDVTVDGRLVRVMLDTAASRVTLFPNRLQSRLPRFHMRGRRAMPNALGISQVVDVDLLDVRLERTAWPGRAMLIDVPPGSYEGLDGVLGGLSKVFRRASFDFENDRLGWEE